MQMIVHDLQLHCRHRGPRTADRSPCRDGAYVAMLPPVCVLVSIEERTGTIAASRQEETQMAASDSTGLGYFMAARFATPEAAYAVYHRIERVLVRSRCDPSVYRLVIDGTPHVVVLGDPPPTAVAARL